jgi:hypothetical protein
VEPRKWWQGDMSEALMVAATVPLVFHVQFTTSHAIFSSLWPVMVLKDILTIESSWTSYRSPLLAIGSKDRTDTFLLFLHLPPHSQPALLQWGNLHLHL